MKNTAAIDTNPIQTEMTLLTQKSETLFSQAQELGRRLTPVLQQPAPKEPRVTTEQKIYDIPMADYLQGINANLKSAQDTLTSIMERNRLPSIED